MHPSLFPLPHTFVPPQHPLPHFAHLTPPSPSAMLGPVFTVALLVMSSLFAPFAARSMSAASASMRSFLTLDSFYSPFAPPPMPSHRLTYPNTDSERPVIFKPAVDVVAIAIAASAPRQDVSRSEVSCICLTTCHATSSFAHTLIQSNSSSGRLCLHPLLLLAACPGIVW